MFQDRKEAGHLLAVKLNFYKAHKNVIVLGLARGGVVVAAEIAKELSLPLNVVVPRKIGAHGNPELALGAIVENGEGVFNSSIIQMLGVSRAYLEREIQKERERAHQRLSRYRQYVPLPDISNQTVILVDDGIATGSTMLASIQAMRQAQALRIIVAVPVASIDALNLIEEAADEVICLHSDEDFVAVGLYYRDFRQTEDEQVIQLLKNINLNSKITESTSQNSKKNVAVNIPIGSIHLEGELEIPEQAKGLILFAHGSGSSRFSPRNQFVAKFLRQHQLATLLIDLLTPKEDKLDDFTREFRFNIELLAERLIGVTNWLLQEAATQSLSIGYFGASTGAAAALIAAAKEGKSIKAVVSRGGRPDLASTFLSRVKAATLLIVGEDDTVVIKLNEEAYAQLSSEKRLDIVPGATHLFEEPGTLEQVAHLASQWFLKYLVKFD